MTAVRIYVTYKQSVFDPQGETITNSLHSLGYDQVAEVKVGKFFDVQLKATEQAVIDQTVKEIAEQLLVNFNLETYRYEVMEEA